MRRTVLKLIRPFYEFGKEIPILAYVMFSILEIYNARVSKKYSSISFEQTVHSNCDSNHVAGNSVDLVTVAFNNEHLIGLQIELFKKYLPSNHILTIADNSNNRDKSEKIKAVCLESNIGYIKLPPNPRKQVNLSHSVALNWIYYNYLLPRQAKIFGFLDHDIFPIRETSIESFLKDSISIYGYVQQKFSTDKKRFWYLWAGFCFFKSESLLGKKINFSSVVISKPSWYVELDTGGGNYESIYSKVETQKLKAAQVILTEDGKEKIDDWVHFQKSSFKDASEIEKFIGELSSYNGHQQ